MRSGGTKTKQKGDKKEQKKEIGKSFNTRKLSWGLRKTNQ